nr:MAG TPA: hypothetical protein [Caudoviricetes sp.]
MPLPWVRYHHLMVYQSRGHPLQMFRFGINMPLWKCRLS